MRLVIRRARFRSGLRFWRRCRLRRTVVSARAAMLAMRSAAAAAVAVAMMVLARRLRADRIREAFQEMARYGPADQPFDGIHVFRVARRDQHVGVAGASRAAGAADTVHVVVRVV